MTRESFDSAMNELTFQLGCEVVVEAPQANEPRELTIRLGCRLYSTRWCHDERRTLYIVRSLAAGVYHASHEHRVNVPRVRDNDGAALAEVEVARLETRLFRQLAHGRVVRSLVC